MENVISPTPNTIRKVKTKFLAKFSKFLPILHFSSAKIEDHSSSIDEQGDLENQIQKSNSHSDDTLLTFSSSRSSSSSLSFPASTKKIPSTSPDWRETKSESHKFSKRWLTQVVTENMVAQELGKAILGFSFPTITGLLLYAQTSHLTSLGIIHVVIMLLSTGCSFILMGLLLRGTSVLNTNVIEQIGVAIDLLGFHILMGFFLPPLIRWFPGLLSIFTILPFFLAACFPSKFSSHAGQPEPM